MAHRLRDKIEGVLNTDRTVRLVVQLEAALHDSRFEVIHHAVDACHFAATVEAVSLRSFCAHKIKAFWRNLGYHSLQEAAHLRDELAREYDMRAQAAVREKQQLDL